MTLVMKVDLGGWLSPRSLLRRCGRPLADALLRAWLEPMLLSVVMLRDKASGGLRLPACLHGPGWCGCAWSPRRGTRRVPSCLARPAGSLRAQRVPERGRPALPLSLEHPRSD